MTQPGSFDLSAIEVSPMPLSSEARGRQDDWTGCSNRAMRKKIQNRLNQRASRRRRGCSAYGLDQPSEDVQHERYLELNTSVSQFLNSRTIYPVYSSGSEDYGQTCQIVSSAAAGSPLRMSGEAVKSQMCIPRPTLNSIIAADNFTTFISLQSKGETIVEDGKIILPFSADHLLTLMHFNLVRGFTINVLSLGLDPRLMHSDIASPFVSKEMSSVADQTLHLPPNLQPTTLQTSVPHHPEIDVLPYPRIRDNAIRALGTYDDFELCLDILGLDHKVISALEGDRGLDMARTGLVVWGEPWYPGSWEVSEAFARKWQWLLCGCNEILESTNYWRQQRGENPLTLSL